MEKRNLPNATTVLILGIISIVSSCCCYGVIGLILGIIAMVLAKKDLVLYNENPDLYLNYSNIKIGRILAIIGIVLSTIYLVFNVYLYVAIGEEAILEFQQNLMNKIQAQQAE